MGRIFDALRANLDGEGLRYDVLESATVLRFGFRTEQHQWRCVAEVREAQDLLLLVSFLPKRADEAQRPAVAELMMRLNCNLAIGNFELDYDKGEARFRTSLDLEGAGVAPTLIRQLVRANLSTVARYIGALERVAAGEATPAEALAALPKPSRGT
jgi:hypothetical protein